MQHKRFSVLALSALTCTWLFLHLYGRADHVTHNDVTLEGLRRGTELDELRLVTVAFGPFLDLYDESIKRMRLYADQMGYKHVILSELTTKCHPRYEPYFAKICVIAEYFATVPDGTVAIVFDADYTPALPLIPVKEEWASPEANLSFYERCWGLLPPEDAVSGTEIASGSFIVRNSEQTRIFFEKWLDYNLMVKVGAGGFTGGDNGPLHLNILREAGLEDHRNPSCAKLYMGIADDILNGGVPRSYSEYVKCCKDKIGPLPAFLPPRSKGAPSIKVHAATTAWGIDVNCRDTERLRTPFHHGIKDVEFLIEHFPVDEYNLKAGQAGNIGEI